LNPGNLETELDRHANGLELIYRKLTVYPAINGAYTELFAGLSEEVTTARIADSGEWGEITFTTVLNHLERS
jgi:retinol dehydrogenase 12